MNPIAATTTVGSRAEAQVMARALVERKHELAAVHAVALRHVYAPYAQWIRSTSTGT